MTINYSFKLLIPKLLSISLKIINEISNVKEHHETEAAVLRCYYKKVF